ncbi:MAG: PD-(D/E)XK nuclease family protein [Culicoidibacterales bacterium]
MFIIHQGMSGTGKTTALMDMILQQDKQVIYLVPDQMSVHTERYVTSRVKNKATTNVYVYTFKLLEKQILKQSENQVYTEFGIIEQFFLLLRILEREETNIKALRHMKHNSDQIHECLELFSLWRNQCIDSEILLQSEVDGKMKDLFYLYHCFMNEQKEDMYFPEEIYRLASSSLEITPFFENKIVIIDGFYLFSETEKVMLSYVLKQADDIHLTLPQYINGEMPSQLVKTKQDMMEMAQLFNHSTKVEIYDTVVRQERDTALYTLVENLPNTNKMLGSKDDSLQFLAAQTVDEEVHELASRIRYAVMNENIAYSDCVIYLADMPTYRDKIVDIFRLYDIPVFLDAKENIHYTPIAQLIHLFVDMLTSKITGGRLIALLKTGFFMPLSDVYKLEPVLQMYTLKDESAFSSDKWELYLAQFEADTEWTQRFEQLQQIVDTLIEYKRSFGKKRQFGLKLQQMFNCFDEFKIFEQLNEEMDAAILQMFADRIDSLFELFEKETLTNAMFAVIMEMVIGQITYMKQPSSQNQVIIADFTRSRISQNMQLSGSLGVKNVYIPGFIQGNIPPFTPEFTLIHQEELDTEELKQLIPTKQQEYELRYMYIYLAFAQASNRLTLTYSKRSRDNAVNAVHRMFELLQKSSNNEIQKAQSIVNPYVPTYTLLSEEALLFSPFLSEHKQFIKTKDEMQNISIDIDDMPYSVSQFERYNNCPFQYFLERKVGLKDTIRTFTDSRTIGNIAHDFMEYIAKEAITDIETSDPLVLADSFLTRYENERLGFSFEKENAYTQLLRKKICQHLGDNMNRYIYFRQHAQFVPFATEAVFHIELNGKKIRGKIDRVDVAEFENNSYFQVIDYKSGARTFDWTRFNAGVQIQLPFYVYAKEGMIKKLPNDAIPYGFYYQTLKVDDKYDVDSVNLDGYTRHNSNLIEALNDDIGVYSGMKIKKDGTIGSLAKTLTDDQFDSLREKTESIAQDTMFQIESGHFDVSPLSYSEKGRVHEPDACQYCRFQGICQREMLGKADFRKVEKVKQEDIV